VGAIALALQFISAPGAGWSSKTRGPLRAQQRARYPAHGIVRPTQGELVGEARELLRSVDHERIEADRGL